MSVDRRKSTAAPVSRGRKAKTPGRGGAAKPTKPRVCRCAAYAWPHRAAGGLCRWPDPPRAACPTPAGTNRPKAQRRRGLRRTLLHDCGLHPIKDRAIIAKVLPILYARPRMLLSDALREVGLCPHGPIKG